mmetsp:Transcript_21499/g.50127  ORF Transcript_21499/g.50127 Transcript_21499/m.50127 type:complete len:342 (-) Transcript_21499:216-1241(-)
MLSGNSTDTLEHRVQILLCLSKEVCHLDVSCWRFLFCSAAAARCCGAGASSCPFGTIGLLGSLLLREWVLHPIQRICHKEDLPSEDPSPLRISSILPGPTPIAINRASWGCRAQLAPWQVEIPSGATHGYQPPVAPQSFAIASQAPASTKYLDSMPHNEGSQCTCNIFVSEKVLVQLCHDVAIQQFDEGALRPSLNRAKMSAPNSQELIQSQVAHICLSRGHIWSWRGLKRCLALQQTLKESLSHQQWCPASSAREGEQPFISKGLDKAQQTLLDHAIFLLRPYPQASQNLTIVGIAIRCVRFRILSQADAEQCVKFLLGLFKQIDHVGQLWHRYLDLWRR